jgi:glycosyltransferase involved in cell wall biosynthesis
MTGGDLSRPKQAPLLSICIPTFNRAACLDNCLASLERATLTCRDEIELTLSDNASTDRTADVVGAYALRFPIRYIKNVTNIGGERNFLSSAGHAIAEYVWVFGDDDEFGEASVTEFLRYIKSGYDLILANFSSWSKDMDSIIAKSALSSTYPTEYSDPETILSTFGILLGYISSVVVRKSLLLSTPSSEYEVFVPYGFPFPYCIYCGLRRGGRMAYVPTPIFKRREHNSDFNGPNSHTMWLKFFIEGPALVFEALERKGYSALVVRRAKNRNLRDFGIANVLSGISAIDRPAVRSLMYRHYRSSWRYWFVWMPILLLPPGFVRIAHRLYRLTRDRARSLMYPPSIPAS